jgi:hypothetical protein
MRKLTALIAITVVFLVTAGTTHAQLLPQSTLIKANGALSVAKVSTTDEVVLGWGLGVGVEQMQWSNRYSVGLSANFARATEKNDSLDASYNSIPVFITFKYLFGTNRRTGYVGGGVGVHFARVSGTRADGSDIDESDNGMSVAGVLGSYIWFWKDTSINLEYVFNWSDTDIFKNGIIHLINVGVAFQF